MFTKRDLNNQIFVGIVENVYDDERKGRIQVRVESVFNGIELEHIPWASPQRSLDGRSFSVPSIGKLVNVIFINGNIYEPQYIYSENYNKNLQSKLESMSDEDYENFTAFLYDHQTQIFKDEEGLTIDHLYNKITMDDESINVELKNNDGVITLGSSDADQEAVLGTNFFEWMDGFMKTLLQPSSLIGNFGAPILKPTVDSEIMKYQTLRETFVSDNVFLNDDAKIRTLDRESNINMQDVDYTKNDKDLNTDIKPKKDIKNKETKKQEQEIDNSPIEEKVADKNKKEMEKMEKLSPNNNGGDPPSGTKIDDANNINPVTEQEKTDTIEDSIKNTNASDNPKENPNPKQIKPEPVTYDDPYSSYFGDSKEKSSEKVTTNKTYGSYSTGSGGSGSGSGSSGTGNQELNMDASSSFTQTELSWKPGYTCVKVHGKKLFEKETFTSNIDPRLQKLVDYLNIELKKWNSSYKIKNAGGARSVENTLITGGKGASQVKKQLPEIYENIIALRNKYNIKANMNRVMTSNHMVGAAVDCIQWINGVEYKYSLRNKNGHTYKEMRAVVSNGVTFKDAMTKAINKWSSANGQAVTWGGNYSDKYWPSESHHFEFNQSIKMRLNAIAEGWDAGKEWRNIIV